MTFKEAFEHYRSGSASEEERKFVEEELEKNRLIEEYMDEVWEDTLDNAKVPADEIKRVRSNLRRRNGLIVLISIVLSAAIFTATAYWILPMIEKSYIDPQENSFETEYSNDFELTLAAFSELFVPCSSINYVSSEHTGFATYDLAIQYYDSTSEKNIEYAYGNIKKNEIFIPANVLNTLPVNIFERACYPEYSLSEETKQSFYDKLTVLPDYVKITAAVSFKDDMDMEALTEFKESLKDASIDWVGIRNCSEDEQRYPLIGMSPFSGGVIREEINEAYPCFEIKTEEKTAENLKQHFKSLLQFSDDRKNNGLSIADFIYNDYYKDILNYIEENGIYTYGCYITGSPKALRELLDNGTASQIWIQNVKFDIW